MPRSLPEDPPGDDPRHALHDGPKGRASAPGPKPPGDLGPTPLCTPFPLGYTDAPPPAPPAPSRHTPGRPPTPRPKR